MGREDLSHEQDSPEDPGSSSVSLSDEISAQICVDNDASGASDEHVEKEVAAWLQQRSTAEINKLKQSGVRSIPLRVRNMGLVRREDGDVWNRVEMVTSMDFNKVVQILLAPAEPCPAKKDTQFVTVLLFTESLTEAQEGKMPTPMVVPYVYSTKVQNSLRYWRFVNSRLEYSDHEVEGFEDL